MEEESKRKKREVEGRVLDKVGELISAIKVAKHVSQVICALHSLAVLFPLDSSIISDVASSWLACFPISAKKHVYDSFFVSGPSTEVQIFVSCLQPNGNDSLDVNAVQ